MGLTGGRVRQRKLAASERVQTVISTTRYRWWVGNNSLIVVETHFHNKKGSTVAAQLSCFGLGSVINTGSSVAQRLSHFTHNPKVAGLNPDQSNITHGASL